MTVNAILMPALPGLAPVPFVLIMVYDPDNPAATYNVTLTISDGTVLIQTISHQGDNAIAAWPIDLTGKTATWQVDVIGAAKGNVNQ